MAAKKANIDELRERAGEVADLLKCLSHRNRLLIACQLTEGEQTVSEIEEKTGVLQPVLSRELARLRRDGLLETRRESRMIHYSLADERLPALVAALCGAFAPASKRAIKRQVPSGKRAALRVSRRRI